MKLARVVLGIELTIGVMSRLGVSLICILAVIGSVAGLLSLLAAYPNG